jgi:hypothetical protein
LHKPKSALQFRVTSGHAATTKFTAPGRRLLPKRKTEMKFVREALIPIYTIRTLTGTSHEV